MRDKTYRLIEGLLQDFRDQISGLIVKTTNDTRTWQRREIADRIDAIQPYHIDMNQELADAIVEKLHGPLTISQETSDWLRKVAQYKEMQYTQPIGYGPESGQLWTRITTDGRLHIQMTDGNGATFWEGTFVPPDFGKDKS